ncbi:hypothetical protein [Hydrotalea sp.]|uniref:hypothetical protein n=1 Tax=Hydrotalea sp. TaxID=2881279 RepID=UPI002629E329|nr:hypothetical protein [Hydrotalea sp.]
MNPPENALVISVDGKTQIQALARTQPILPLKEKAPKRLTATYKRNDTVALIAALAVHKGDITAKTMDKNTAPKLSSISQTTLSKISQKAPACYCR